MTKAIITGVTGQDGSYLAENLLGRGWHVVGVKRRSSNNANHTWRLAKILNHARFHLEEGDVCDPAYTFSSLLTHKPDVVFNLAAQSHVATSFTQPMTTFDITGKAVLNYLEGIRLLSPSTRFYQASSSEMFGNSVSYLEKDYYTSRTDTYYELGMEKYNSIFQDEHTPFHPQSPYAIAKLAAHNLISLYRKSYGLFCVSGILFNHECFKYDYPFIINVNGEIRIDSIEDIASTFASFTRDKDEDNKMGTLINDVKVWDNNQWTKVNCISWFKNKNKKLKLVNSRNAIYSISDDHECILEDNSTTKDIKLHDKIKTVRYPNIQKISTISEDEAELLGMLVGDGYIGKSRVQFTNKNKKILKKFNDLWHKVTGGYTKYYKSTSGFTKNEVGRLDAFYNDNKKIISKDIIYSRSKCVFNHRYKKVPYVILNSSSNIMLAFLRGYNICDGLKKNKCTYEFKNFKTNSPILSAGLLYLISQTTQQEFTLNIETSMSYGKRQYYYSINLLSPKNNNKYVIVNKMISDGLSQREINRRTKISRTFIRKVANKTYISTNHHFKRISNEVKKILVYNDYNDYFFDIETQSNTLHAGIGVGLVHNSPRRGDLFVTKKIVNYCKYLRHTLNNGKIPMLLELGNTNVFRDWGHASDYVEAMRLMMEADVPKDYIVGTGEAYSVEDFLSATFSLIGIDDYRKYVIHSPSLYRPSDVPFLRSNPEKIMRELGWRPIMSFQKLVEDMIENE